MHDINEKQHIDSFAGPQDRNGKAKKRPTLIRSGVVLFFLFSTAATAGASTIFFDSEFNLGDWSFQSYTTGVGGTFTTTHESAGGFAGAYIRFDTTVFNSANPREQLIASLYNAGTWNPSIQGGIAHVDFQISDLGIPASGGIGHGFGALLSQGGNIYDAGFATSDLNWTTRLFPGFNFQSFSKYSGSGPSHPDFSSNGGIIKFGFYVYSGNAAVNLGDQVLATGFDNWQMTIIAVPEPGGLALMSLAGFLGISRRVLRRRIAQRNTAII
jgi:hypothetical protein